MYNVFHMKLYILVKWDVLSPVDLTEHFLFSFQLAKTFVDTTFVSTKYQCSSEFFQIGMPHFSLEGVFLVPVSLSFLLFVLVVPIKKYINIIFCSKFNNKNFSFSSGKSITPRLARSLWANPLPCIDERFYNC